MPHGSWASNAQTLRATCEAYFALLSLPALCRSLARPEGPPLKAFRIPPDKDGANQIQIVRSIEAEAAEIARRNGFGEVITYVQGKVRWVATGHIQGCIGDATSQGRAARATAGGGSIRRACTAKS